MNTVTDRNISARKSQCLAVTSGKQSMCTDRVVNDVGSYFTRPQIIILDFGCPSLNGWY